jgi:signal transduction histidine kinase
MLVFSGVCIIATVGLWTLGRWSPIPMNILGICTVILSFCVFGGSWFIFGGERGMTPPLLFWTICLIFLFDQRREQIIVLIMILIFVTSLFAIEVYFPDLINPYYPNDEVRFLDVAVTYLLALSGYCGFVLSMTWLHVNTSQQLQREQKLRATLEQQTIEAQAREREEKLELLSRMSRGLAHDLNNLLMVISNSSEMIENSLPTLESNEHIREDLNAIIDTSSTASRLTKRLLDYDYIPELSPEIISLSAFLKTQEPILSRISEDVTIHIEADDHHASIRIHRSELEQVIINLALNGIQAMNHRGDLYVRCYVKEGVIHLEVEDTGIGISSEHLESIFEPLFTTKRELGGTGIGLSTVHNIVSRYQAKITVDSKLSIGTRFLICFPSA